MNSIQFNKYIRPFSLLVVLILIFVVFNSVASAQSSVVCEGLNANGDFCSTPATSPTINQILRSVLNILSTVAGIAAVIMFIIGGLKYITAQGDPKSINTAKNALIYASIGLIIVAVSQTIVFFLIKEAASAI